MAHQSPPLPDGHSAGGHENMFPRAHSVPDSKRAAGSTQFQSGTPRGLEVISRWHGFQGRLVRNPVPIPLNFVCKFTPNHIYNPHITHIYVCKFTPKGLAALGRPCRPSPGGPGWACTRFLQAFLPMPVTRYPCDHSNGSACKGKCAFRFRIWSVRGHISCRQKHFSSSSTVVFYSGNGYVEASCRGAWCMQQMPMPMRYASRLAGTSHGAFVAACRRIPRGEEEQDMQEAKQGNVQQSNEASVSANQMAMLLIEVLCTWFSLDGVGEPQTNACLSIR